MEQKEKPGLGGTGQKNLQHSGELGKQHNNTNYLQFCQGSAFEAACAYVEHGLPVFPCNTDKAPLTKHGFKDATRDIDQVKRWWKKWPNASIGMPTGETSGLWVLDVDTYKTEGAESFKQLIQRHGPLPNTRAQTTGGGGAQYFFKHNGGCISSSNGKIAPGLDIKADGGYVILPPSNHPTGNKYQWDNEGPVADAPEWLLKLAKEAKKTKPTCSPPISGTPSTNSSYGLKALENEVQAVRVAPEGTRNDTLNRSAFSIGQLIAGGELDQVKVEDNLLTAAIRAGLPENEARRTIQSGITAGMQEPRSAPTSDTSPFSGPGELKITSTKKPWDCVREIIPRTHFPWDVFPEDIKYSLTTLAHSCATDSTPLPGIAFAMIAAAVGRTVIISPKIGWEEPSVFWAIDIRESGEGKTPAMWLMADVIKKIQKEKHDEYERDYEEWQSKPQKKRGEPPPPARGYYCTDLTLEGLRTDLNKHPTGGIIALMNEASSLINAQNQYKQKGTDREAWLALHDGQPARIVRAEKKYLIHGARVQVVGGIQPEIFKRVFGGQEGQYLADGTIFRCLLVYSPPSHHDLTTQGWTEEERLKWENTLKKAYEWSEKNQETKLTIKLSDEAQEVFFSWRNCLNRQKTLLPKEIRGFLPKTYGNALRLAAVIDCIHQFSQGKEPRPLLDKQGMERGIRAALFYLGQAVDAIMIIFGDNPVIDNTQLKIVEALQDGPMTATDISNKVFNRHMSSGKIQEALEELKAAGQVIETTEPTTGRPRTLYALSSHNSHYSQGIEVKEDIAEHVQAEISEPEQSGSDVTVCADDGDEVEI